MNAIKHLVFFKLKHEKGSKESEMFIKDGRDLLASIPEVQKLEILRQISRDNEYDYAFYMEFASQSDYDKYTEIPGHVKFVEQRWLSEVESSFEADFEFFVPNQNPA